MRLERTSDPPLMLHWNDTPHTLHDRWPMAAFLSSFTRMEFSWLQKRHWKVVDSDSF